MFKSVVRTAAAPTLARALPRARPVRRFISTAPPHQQSRSWKSSATRWGLAGALVYYYNTSSVFAEEPAYAVQSPPDTRHETETYPTVEAISEQRRSKQSSQADQTHATSVATAPDAESPAAGSPDALEEEASQQGAFNEETGEINWDCPCLGGMAYGPCGDQFRAAFSCFVFSKDEPKGVDCIDHFKAMQNCFREHPDMYGSELEDDEAPPQEGEDQGASDAGQTSAPPAPEAGEDQAAVKASKPADTGAAKSAESTSGRGPKSDTAPQRSVESTPSPQSQPERAATSPSDVSVEQHTNVEKAEDELVPKSWHDGR